MNQHEAGNSTRRSHRNPTPVTRTKPSLHPFKVHFHPPTPMDGCNRSTHYRERAASEFLWHSCSHLASSRNSDSASKRVKTACTTTPLCHFHHIVAVLSKPKRFLTPLWASTRTRYSSWLGHGLFVLCGAPFTLDSNIQVSILQHEATEIEDRGAVCRIGEHLTVIDDIKSKKKLSVNVFKQIITCLNKPETVFMPSLECWMHSYFIDFLNFRIRPGHKFESIGECAGEGEVSTLSASLSWPLSKKTLSSYSASCWSCEFSRL
jgi:hypothetical protein